MNPLIIKYIQYFRLLWIKNKSYKWSIYFISVDLNISETEAEELWNEYCNNRIRYNNLNDK